MGREECTPTLFPASVMEAGWVKKKQCQGTPIILPPAWGTLFPACVIMGRKECRGTLFPAHYKGNDVINSVILSTPPACILHVKLKLKLSPQVPFVGGVPFYVSSKCI